MSKTNKFETDYAALYPGVDIPADVLVVLKKSDRKMRYMEQDLKQGRPLKDENGDTIAILPGREDSYERLLETDKQFEDDSADPERVVIEQVEIQELHHALMLLNEDERALIEALFFNGFTEREYAASLRLSKTAIHERKIKLMDKLKRILES